VDIDIFT